LTQGDNRTFRGKLVKSATSRTARPASRRFFAVPSVETARLYGERDNCAKSTRPVLSVHAQQRAAIFLSLLKAIAPELPGKKKKKKKKKKKNWAGRLEKKRPRNCLNFPSI